MWGLWWIVKKVWKCCGSGYSQKGRTKGGLEKGDNTKSRTSCGWDPESDSKESSNLKKLLD